MSVYDVKQLLASTDFTRHVAEQISPKYESQR